MIEYRNVNIARGGKPILKDVNFCIEQGEKIAFTGPSGCGKSSLLMALAGASPICSGEIFIDGIKLSPATAGEIRRKVAFVGQEPALSAETIREAILLPFTFKANKNKFPEEKTIHDTLAKLGLATDIMDKRCAVVSGGERQRIAVARALLLEKTIFLADEITSALDDASRQAVISLLKMPELTVVSVAHDRIWQENCTRLLEIRDQSIHEKQKAAN